MLGDVVALEVSLILLSRGGNDLGPLLLWLFHGGAVQVAVCINIHCIFLFAT